MSLSSNSSLFMRAVSVNQPFYLTKEGPAFDIDRYDNTQSLRHKTNMFFMTQADSLHRTLFSTLNESLLCNAEHFIS